MIYLSSSLIGHEEVIVNSPLLPNNNNLSYCISILKFKYAGVGDLGKIAIFTVFNNFKNLNLLIVNFIFFSFYLIIYIIYI